MPQFVLATSCPDRTGIVAGISGFIAERRGLIHEAAHFVDDYSNRSFMRTRFSGETLPDLTTLRSEFAALAQQFAMDWTLHPAERRIKVLVAVSARGHCLNSLLHRWSMGTCQSR